MGDPTDLAFLALSPGSRTHLGHRHQDLARFRPLHARTIWRSARTPHYKTVVQLGGEAHDLIDAIAALPGRSAPKPPSASERSNPSRRLPPHGPLRRRPPRDRAFQHRARSRATGAIVPTARQEIRTRLGLAGTPLAAFTYQTLSKADYDRFLASYLKCRRLGAQGFRQTEYRAFRRAQAGLDLRLFPRRGGTKTRTATASLAHLQIKRAESGRSGESAWPRKLYLEVLLPNAEPVVEINLPGLKSARTACPKRCG